MAPQRQYEIRFFIPIAAILIGTISGCATRYNVSPSADRARLRIVVDRPADTHLSLAGAFGGQGCEESGGGRLAAFSGNPNSTGGFRTSLGMPGGESIPPNLRHEFELPAGKPFTFIIQQSRDTGKVDVIGSTVVIGRKECAVTTSFTPTANEQYEAHYSFSLEAGGCIVRLSQLIERDNGLVRVPYPKQTLSCKYSPRW
jgi:hypothetical protein